MATIEKRETKDGEVRWSMRVFAILAIAMLGCAPAERIGLYSTTVDAGPNDVPDKVGTFDNAGECAEAAARLKSAGAETWVYYCADDTPER